MKEKKATRARGTEANYDAGNALRVRAAKEESTDKAGWSERVSFF